MIDVDGYVHFGESQFCSIIDSVNEYKLLNQKDFYERLDKVFNEYIDKGKLCNKCNQVKNCNEFQLRVLDLI